MTSKLIEKNGEGLEEEEAAKEDEEGGEAERGRAYMLIVYISFSNGFAQ